MRTPPLKSRGRPEVITAHRLLVDAFLVGVAVQFFLAGLGVFRAKPAGTQRLAASSAFDPHRTLGNALIFLAVVILVLAVWAARQLRPSAALCALTILQSAWAKVGGSAPAVAALHVLGAFAIAILAYSMHRSGRARAQRSRVKAAGPPQPERSTSCECSSRERVVRSAPDSFRS